MRVVQVKKEDWAKLSEQAHLVVFEEKRHAENDRVDFALLAENDKGLPLVYATCRELSGDSLYFQYGGAFPGTRGTAMTSKCFNALIGWAIERYARLSFYVENTNIAMLKLAMKHGFKITGIRNYKDSVLLEHLLEWR